MNEWKGFDFSCTIETKLDGLINLPAIQTILLEKKVWEKIKIYIWNRNRVNIFSGIEVSF